MAGNTVDIAAAEAAKESDSERYERSTIEFPYGDLEDALALADAIHEHAGTSCTVDQLAAFLKASAKSGAYRLNLSTSRVFGLIETEKGIVSLTDLGRRAVDPSQRGRAIAESFLTVPLYRAIYDKYRGHHLPPAAALEREMGNLGVAKKQTRKARQAFERSAEQSGYFAQGHERLVEPINRENAPPAAPAAADRNKLGGGGGGGDDLHHFILGLIDTLPAPDSVWPTRERKKWIQTAESVFSLIYKDESSDGGNGSE